MILKSYSLQNKIFKMGDIILFYGKNEGLKKEEILKIVYSNKDCNITNYDEKEFLDNRENFFNNILSQSLFEKDKIIIINRASDKIFKILEEIITIDIKDILLIINSENLEKKSKLRSFFEKNKRLVCVPFYPDNDQTLSKLSYNFLRDKKISISSSNINVIINKCNGDRETLINELQKIESFSKNGKKISTENILKLINLKENHSISELIDNCLAQNKKKTIIKHT